MKDGLLTITTKWGRTISRCGVIVYKGIAL